MCDVFNRFSNLTIKKQKFQTFSTEKRIKDLEETSGNKWNPESIRKACAVNFDNWFNSNVKDKTRKDFDKAFHNTAKRSAQYKSKSCILDLVNGPIISEDTYHSLQ